MGAFGQIYIPVEGQVTVFDDTGGTAVLTCVESEDGCDGCYYKRESGKPQYAFCRSVACGTFERLDEKSVIFQQLKIKL